MNGQKGVNKNTRSYANEGMGSTYHEVQALRYPISVGTVPVSRPSVMENDLKLLSKPISVGIVPVTSK